MKKDIVKSYILESIGQLLPDESIMSRHALCKKLGFSRTTVDTAVGELIKEGVLYTVNGSGTYVSEEYRTQRKTSTARESWGVVVPDMAKNIYPQFLMGIEDYCLEHDVNVIITNTSHDLEKQNHCLIRLIESGVTGLILYPAHMTELDLSVILDIQRKGFPLVLCNRHVDVMSMVPVATCNDFYGGYLAGKHMIKMGYRRFAYVSPLRTKSANDRYEGFATALMENNIVIQRSAVKIYLENRLEKKTLMQIAADVQQLIQGKEQIDAVFCYNDATAPYVYQAIRHSGKQISDAVGVIGYDNAAIAEALYPTLTTIQYPAYEMGLQCARLLRDSISGTTDRYNPIYLLRPELIHRESALGKGE